MLQPIFYMFTRCVLCNEKSIETMEKSIVTMENSMNTMEKTMTTLGKSMNSMENWKKTWKNRWTVQMANFSFKIQQSTGFFSKMKQIARKSAPYWNKKQLHPFVKINFATFGKHMQVRPLQVPKVGQMWSISKQHIECNCEKCGLHQQQRHWPTGNWIKFRWTVIFAGKFQCSLSMA